MIRNVTVKGLTWRAARFGRRRLGACGRQAPLALGYVSLLIAFCVQGPAVSQISTQELTRETALERRTAVQAQLHELDQSGLSAEEIEAAKLRLGQLLAALASFEEAVQRRDSFRSQLESLPQRLEEALASRRELENRAPTPLPEITEALRAEYEARRQSLHAEVGRLTSQTTSEGVRLARLADQIQAVKSSLVELLAERQSPAAPAEQEGSLVSQAELLDVRIQEHRRQSRGARGGTPMAHRTGSAARCSAPRCPAAPEAGRGGPAQNPDRPGRNHPGAASVVGPTCGAAAGGSAGVHLCSRQDSSSGSTGHGACAPACR